ncbi:MAG: PAS domain S-box protein, partial [Gammaproteobacteria bacterium]|nr:PAS domain S-box protein [Gammaproteobacteria bacterium]
MPAESTILVLGVTDSHLQALVRKHIGVYGAVANFDTPPGGDIDASAVVLFVEQRGAEQVRACRHAASYALVAVTEDDTFSHAQALLDAGADEILLSSQLERLPVSLAAAAKAVAARSTHDNDYAFHKAVNDHSPTEIFVKDVTGRYIYVNRTTAERYAQLTDDFIGKLPEDIFAAAETAGIVEHDRQVLAEGQVVTRTVSILEHHLHVSKFPIYGGDWDIIGLGAIAVDMSEQQKALQALRTSEARLLDYAELAADIFYETGPDWLLTRCDGRLQEITGLSSRSVIATKRPEITRQDREKYPEKWHALKERLKRHEAVSGFELEWTRSDGQQITLLNNIKPMFDQGGEFAGYRGVAVDVTALRDTQRALREEEEHCRFLVENSSDFVTVLDDHGLIRYQSPWIAVETGNTTGDRIGKSLLQYVHPDDRDYVEAAIDGMLREAGRQETLVYRFQTKDGDWRHTESRCRSVAGKSGALEIIVNSRDASKGVAAEKALRVSEEHFRNLVEGSLQGILIHNLEDVLFVNQAFLDIFGYTSLDEIKTAYVEQRVIAEHDRDRIRRYAKSRLAGDGEPQRYELDAIKADGSVIRIEASGRRINWQGKPALQTTVLDITERKRAERTLQKELRRNQIVLESSQDGFFTCDLNGKLRDTNRAYERMLGYAPGEMVGMNLADIEVLEKPSEIKKHLARVALEGQDFFETKHRHKDGHKVDFEVAVTAATIDKDQFIFSFMRDVTDRNKALADLRESQARLRALTTLAPAGIFRTDKDGRTIYVNEHWKELTGIVDRRLGSDDWIKHMHGEDRERVLKHWQDRLATRTVFRDEYRYQRPLGSLVWVYCVANPQYDQQAEFTGYIGTLTNITARKQAQSELESYRDHLEELVDARTAELRAAVREQESFSYSVSHDLRSPLRTIDGFSHMLLTSTA